MFISLFHYFMQIQAFGCPQIFVKQVETVGDCYIIAGGLMHRDRDGVSSVQTDIYSMHALTVLQFAKVCVMLESSEIGFRVAVAIHYARY